jgi:hypothetical protein
VRQCRKVLTKIERRRVPVVTSSLRNGIVFGRQEGDGSSRGTASATQVKKQALKVRLKLRQLTGGSHP